MSAEDPRDRVRAVLAIAARIASPNDPLGLEARAALVALGALSAEGVALALARHVETEERTDLDAVIASVTRAPRAWVVASANVCVAAVRAIALALAASPEVRVKPSRRDPVVARILVRELARAGLSVAEVDRIAPSAGDVVHAYGSDETLASIAAGLSPDVRFEGHGTGFGVAAISILDDVDASARALADDVVVFDQAGCLSPRVCVVEGDAARGTAFADALSSALDRRAAEIPRGPLDDGDRRALAAYESTMLSIGEVRGGAEHVVGVDVEASTLLVGPALRVVTVAPFGSVAAALAVLAPVAGRVTALGGAPSPFVDAVAEALPRARRSALGEMQRPSFDGPVDRRTATSSRRP